MEKEGKRDFFARAREKVEKAGPGDDDVLCGYLQTLGELASDGK